MSIAASQFEHVADLAVRVAKPTVVRASRAKEAFAKLLLASAPAQTG